MTGARGAFVKVGAGVHSEVFRRPGSRYVLQVFRPDCPELTVEKIRAEYAYLCAVYAELPALIPRQRLIRPGTDAPLRDCVLVKDYVPHRPEEALHRVDPARLTAGTREQLARFLHITRSLLADLPHPSAGVDMPMLPDIIDPHWANLVLDSGTGDLVLIDTNRLISARKLARLAAAGQLLGLEEHRIHALLLRRLLFLESTYLGRTYPALRADPVYARYLDAARLAALCAASARAGEPILGTPAEVVLQADGADVGGEHGFGA